MATTYLTRTFQAGGNRRKWTYSVWCKRASLTSSSNGHSLFDITGGSDTYTQLNFLISDSGGSGSATHSLACHTYGGDVFRTTRLLRDISGWYHIVLALDTSQATATDRLKLYVNGELQTYSQETNFPGQDEDLGINRNAAHTIGSQGTVANYYFDGAMSHIHFCDGYQYAASDFGSTDATSGEWKINTSPSVSYGTTGFSILKDGNSVTDQSGEGNDWTVGAGTLTDLQDCPDDVFNTMNPLDNYYSAGTFSNGNNTYVTGTNATPNSSTIGVSKGKFYWEVKYVSKTAGLRYPMIGISSTQTTATNQELGHFANDWAFYASNVTPYYRNNNTNTSYGTIYTEGDIVCVALDADNSKLYFRINGGSWENSGDPTSGATGTGAISITAPASTPKGAYFPTIGYYDSENGTFNANFGNGYFGTTAISSEGTNASEIGKFEYDVPTGYTALSLKGLNS